jgi:hypothetical protein
MSKNRKLRIAVIAILIAVFNVAVFAIPFAHTAGFWISYIFGMASLLSQEIICLAAWGKADKLKSKFLGMPILQIGVAYLAIQLALSIAFIIFSALPWQMPLIASVALLAVCAILMAGADVGRGAIEKTEQKIVGKTSFVKSLGVEIELLVPLAKDEALKKQLKALAEKVRYSDPVSDSSLTPLESEISQIAEQLKVAINSGDHAITASSAEAMAEAIAVRNAKARLLKA